LRVIGKFPERPTADRTWLLMDDTFGYKIIVEMAGCRVAARARTGGQQHLACPRGHQ